MRRPRHLSPEERDLWNRIARHATPLDPMRTAPEPRPAPVPPPRPDPHPPAAEGPRDPLPQFRVGQKADARRPNDLLPGVADRLARQALNMDAKAFGRMKKGKLVPEGRIDLHGMTLSQAHPALNGFILMSHGMGRRLVLVITGKGKDRDDHAPMPVRQGILRHQVPQWLALPPLRPVVLQVTPAHARHGGQGAYYVYLRRG